MRKRMLALLLASGAAAISSAEILIFQGPGNFPDDENILFNETGLLNFGPTVQGISNNTGFVVDFFDAGVDLVTPAGGQARIEADTGTFSQLAILPNDPIVGFRTLIINLNAAEDGEVTFDVDALNGDFLTQTFDIDGGGENFFRIQGTEEDLLGFVTFATTVGIDDVRQIRMGGFEAVPEPATMAALGTGALLLLKGRRRRKG